MIYLQWFDALKSLLFTSNAQSLTPEQHKALYFLGNMWMPEETQIIRLGADNPKTFDRNTAPLAKRPDLYGDGFYLPSPGIIVEDEMSAIGFVDVDTNRPKGLDSKRMFLSIETPVSLRSGSAPATLDELLRLASLQLAYPEETFFLAWGAIESVSDLNLNERLSGLKFHPFGFAGFDRNRLYFAELSSWFVSYLNRQHGGSGADPVMDETISRIGGSLTQNLLHALLQVAYVNALIEEQAGQQGKAGDP